MKIGVVALQGAVEEHMTMLKKCGVTPIAVKMSYDLEGISALIIPGGESTTIGKLMEKYNLDREIIKKHKKGMPVYGTCAGAILLAKNIIGNNSQKKLGLMDISVKRNDYGRQIDSFETYLKISAIGKFRGVFIRAPVIDSVHNGVRIMGTFKEKPVIARQNNLLVTTFHPELTNNTKIHEYFINMVKR